MSCSSSEPTSPDPSPATGTPKMSCVSPLGRPLLLTVQQAAEMIGVGRSTLYRIMDRGEIHSVHVGASRRIPLSAAYAFVDRLVNGCEDHPRERSHR